MAGQRERYQRITANDLITFDELERQIGELNQHKAAADSDLERLSKSNERIERSKWIKSNSILTFLFTGAGKMAEGMRRDYYRDLGLWVVADRTRVEINGSQIVTPTPTWETRR